MPCTTKELIELANQTLRPGEFRDYCPNGLQIEGRDRVQKLVAGVTASQALLDYAVSVEADAVLVHHGYFWRGEPLSLTGLRRRRIATLLANDINLLAYHLPLDAHLELGNNAQLAKRLGLAVDGCAEVDGHDLLFYGRLQSPMLGDALASHIGLSLQRTPLHISPACERAQSPVSTVAWCTGGAQGFIEQASALGVDAFITGEASEQTTHVAREAGLHFFAAGHHATERYGVAALGEFLAHQLGLEFEFADIDNPV